MDPQTIIKKLKSELQKKSSEDYLHKLLSEKLCSLKKISCDADTSLTIKDKKSIKKFEDTHRKISEFIDLKEELVEVIDPEHYSDLRNELEALKDYFDGFAISKRIDKEIRELDSKLPSILEKKSREWSRDLNSKISKLEKNAPKCTRNHYMVIRESEDHEFFWGCSHFPSCRRTKNLSKKEQKHLQGAKGDYQFKQDHHIKKKAKYGKSIKELPDGGTKSIKTNKKPNLKEKCKICGQIYWVDKGCSYCNGSKKDNQSIIEITESTKYEKNKIRVLCPNCGSKMVLREARKGKYKGQQFWGCSRYPVCRGISQYQSL